MVHLDNSQLYSKTEDCVLVASQRVAPPSQWHGEILNLSYINYSLEFPAHCAVLLSCTSLSTFVGPPVCMSNTCLSFLTTPIVYYLFKRKKEVRCLDDKWTGDISVIVNRCILLLKLLKLSHTNIQLHLLIRLFIHAEAWSLIEELRLQSYWREARRGPGAAGTWQIATIIFHIADSIINWPVSFTFSSTKWTKCVFSIIKGEKKTFL